MAEGTRSQTWAREMDELRSDNLTAINSAIDGKLAAMNEKLEGRMSEIFKAIRLISTNGVFTGERNSPSVSGDEMKSMPQFKSDDPISDLKKLEQTGGINEYYIAFDSIRSRINLPEELFLGWFISGLRIETRKEVRTFRPKTVLQAYAIGRLFEAAHPVNSIADSSHSVSPQQPPHQTIPPLIRSIDEESNQQEDEGVCVVLADSCILSEIVESDIAEIRVEQFENDAEFEAEKKVECSRFSVSNMFVTVDAYQLFEEMPEPIPMLKMFGGDIFRISIDERLIKYGFISLLFDPGGENHKRRLAEIDEQFSGNFSSKTGRKVEKSLMITEFDGMIEPVVAMVQSKGPNSYAHELFDEMSTPSLECVLIAEVAGGNRLMVPSTQESFVHSGIVDKFVFDPGGQLGTETEVQVMEVERFKQRHVLFREVDGFMLRVGTFTYVVFDPGGILSEVEDIQGSYKQKLQVPGGEIQKLRANEYGEDKLNGQLNFSFQWDPGGVTYALLGPNCFLKCSLVWVDSGMFGHRFNIGYMMSLMHFLLRSKPLKITVFDPRGGSEFNVMIVCISFPTLVELDDNPQSLRQLLLLSKRFKITNFYPGGAYLGLTTGDEYEVSYQPMLPIHWDPGGFLVGFMCGYIRALLVLMIKGVGRETEWEFVVVQWDPGRCVGAKLWRWQWRHVVLYFLNFLAPGA